MTLPSSQVAAGAIHAGPAVPPAGAKPSSIRSNFYWTLAGNVVYAACQWGMLSVIAKLGSPAMVGQFALALAVTAPVVMLAGAPRYVQITSPPDEFSFGDYTVPRMLVLAGGVLTIAAICAASGYDAATVWTVALVTVAKIADSFSDAAYGLLQQHEVMARIAQSRILQGVLQTVILALTMLATRSVVWGTAALAAISVLVTATFDARSAAAVLSHKPPRQVPYLAANALVVRVAQATFSAASCRRLCVLAAPVGLVAALVTANSSLLRYLVEQNLGPAELGLFAAMTYCGVAGSTVLNALGQAVMPALSRRSRAHDGRGFWAILARLLLLAGALGGGFVAVAWLWGMPIMALLYTREFARNPRELVLIALAAAVGFVGSALGYGLTAARFLRIQLPIHAACTAAIVWLGLLLIRSHGLAGAAWTIMAAGLLQTVASAAILILAGPHRTKPAA